MGILIGYEVMNGYELVRMTKTPLMHALAAFIYVVFIVLVINYVVMKVVPEQTLFIPIAMLSLFVLSAAVMSYLFVYQSVSMCIDGKKDEAVQFFLYTVVIFAVITAIFLAVVSLLV